jgi:hypothetical protein
MYCDWESSEWGHCLLRSFCHNVWIWYSYSDIYDSAVSFHSHIIYKRNVRSAFGDSFVNTHKNELPRSSVYRSLSENGEHWVQFKYCNLPVKRRWCKYLCLSACSVKAESVRRICGWLWFIVIGTLKLSLFVMSTKMIKVNQLYLQLALCSLPRALWKVLYYCAMPITKYCIPMPCPIYFFSAMYNNINVIEFQKSSLSHIQVLYMSFVFLSNTTMYQSTRSHLTVHNWVYWS